jgi:hypothetical protein
LAYNHDRKTETTDPVTKQNIFTAVISTLFQPVFLLDFLSKSRFFADQNFGKTVQFLSSGVVRFRRRFENLDFDVDATEFAKVISLRLKAGQLKLTSLKKTGLKLSVKARNSFSMLKDFKVEFKHNGNQ